MLNADHLVTLLGQEATQEAIEGFFIEHSIRRRPVLDRPAKSPYDVTFHMRQLGITFIFQEYNYVHNHAVRSHGKSKKLLLTGILLSSGIENEIRPFAGTLPFELDWHDDRAMVLKKMASFEDRLHAHKRDCWWFDDYRMTVSYPPGDMTMPPTTGVFEVLFSSYLPPTEKRHQDLRHPAIPTLQALFGKSVRDQDFESAFADFNPQDIAKRSQEDTAVDLQLQYGFQLYFDQDKPAQDGTPSFAGITFYRDRYGPSTQWLGQLPYGIRYIDTPEQVLKKVPSPPDLYEDTTALWGVMKWYLPQYLLWVNFDNLINSIETVSILAPGYRE